MQERGILGKCHATHLWANQRCSLLRSTPLRMVVSAGGYNELGMERIDPHTRQKLASPFSEIFKSSLLTSPKNQVYTSSQEIFTMPHRSTFSAQLSPQELEAFRNLSAQTQSHPDQRPTRR